ncbi:hypothetical protein [Fodinibius sp.]|nr:hypothetical protein [Fodinibius sp.]MDZ7660734.1 hypothetical protein [Fodinibius sp.]
MKDAGAKLVYAFSMGFDTTSIGGMYPLRSITIEKMVQMQEVMKRN